MTALQIALLAASIRSIILRQLMINTVAACVVAAPLPLGPRHRTSPARQREGRTVRAPRRSHRAGSSVRAATTLSLSAGEA